MAPFWRHWAGSPCFSESKAFRKTGGHAARPQVGQHAAPPSKNIYPQKTANTYSGVWQAYKPAPAGLSARQAAKGRKRRC